MQARRERSARRLLEKRGCLLCEVWHKITPGSDGVNYSAHSITTLLAEKYFFGSILSDLNKKTSESCEALLAKRRSKTSDVCIS